MPHHHWTSTSNALCNYHGLHQMAVSTFGPLPSSRCGQWGHTSMTTAVKHTRDTIPISIHESESDEEADPKQFAILNPSGPSAVN